MTTHLKPNPQVAWVDPALEAAFEWAGDDEDRLFPDVLYAYMDLWRVCSAMQREESDA